MVTNGRSDQSHNKGSPEIDPHPRAEKRVVFGPNSPIEEILQGLKRVANSKLPILICGPTGVGKEDLARFVHDTGNGDQDRPFIEVNCGAIPAGLFESELFGHVKGAFTGASADRQGYMTLAGDGTLFLDEVGEIPFDLQAKLLRALEARTFRPVGSSKLCGFNGRVVAATHRNLPALVKAGRFREDLYYRLAVFLFEVPALASRKNDIPELVRYFVSRQMRSLHFTDEAITLLKSHSWPGNTRELRNLIDRLAVLVDADLVEEKALRSFLNVDPLTKSQALKAFAEAVLEVETDENRFSLMENALLCFTLERCDGNKARASRLLNVDRKAVERRYSKLQAYSHSAVDNVRSAEAHIESGDFKSAIHSLEKIANTESICGPFMIEDALLCKAFYLLGICYQRVHGWMSAEAHQFYAKAMEIAETIGDLEMLRSTTFCIWTFRLVELDLQGGRALASDLMRRAKISRDPNALYEAYLASSNTAFWAGDCRDVVDSLEISGLLEPPVGSSLRLHQIDLHSLALMLYGVSAFQIGRFRTARKTLDYLIERSLDKRLPLQDLYFVLQGIEHIAYLFEEWEIMGGAAKILRDDAEAKNYSYFIGIGKMFYGRFLLEQKNYEDCEREINEGFYKYIVQSGGNMYQSLKALMCGEILIRQEKASQCFDLVRSSSEKAIKLQERLFLIELVELQARAQAAMGDIDCACRDLEIACSTAKVLGLLSGQIRCAGQLARLRKFSKRSEDPLWDISFDLPAEEITYAPQSIRETIVLLRPAIRADNDADMGQSHFSKTRTG